MSPGVQRAARNTGQTACINMCLPGPRSRRVRERENRLIAPGVQRLVTEAGIAVERALGSTIIDVDGNRYVDLVGGIGVGGLGHSHPDWVRAVAAQLERFAVGSFTTATRVELLERLEAHAPAAGVNRLQLYSSGAETVESALRLARCATGRDEIVSFWGGFHGKTAGALGLMGSAFKRGFGPLVPGSHVVPYPDPYRPPVDTTGSLTDACLSMAEQQLHYNRAGEIAAFIVEPVQGTAGNVIPPDDFLPKLKDLAQSMGALLIVDEMITGFGRTGSYWGCQRSGVEPDIVVLGKQFGGGIPVAGILAHEFIVSAKPWSEPSASSSSFGGNALAAASAAATLRIIDEEGLVENSHRVGATMLARMQSYPERYPFVGLVRGAGLMIGIELVRDAQTREPLSAEACARLFQEQMSLGLLSMSYAPHYRLQPAMTIDDATAHNALDLLEESFDRMAAAGWWA